MENEAKHTPGCDCFECIGACDCPECKGEARNDMTLSVKCVECGAELGPKALTDVEECPKCGGLDYMVSHKRDTERDEDMDRRAKAQPGAFPRASVGYGINHGHMLDYDKEQRAWYEAADAVYSEEQLSAYSAGLRAGWAKCLATLAAHGHIDIDHSTGGCDHG